MFDTKYVDVSKGETN